jgi:hypothetical protein
MSGSYEGDIVRPLGLISLYAGYAELEIDSLLESLSILESLDAPSFQSPVGRKLTYAKEVIDSLPSEGLAALQQKLDEALVLFDRRNALVHNAIFTCTQTVTSRVSGREQKVSPESLTELAQQIFSCKEHINANRQRVLEPLIATMRGNSKA